MKNICKLLTSTLFIAILFSCSEQADSPIINEGAEPEIISTGHEFTEGPYWHPDGYLLFSDIPANRIYRWEPGAEAEVFIEPSGNANGIQADIDGSVILCQHAGRLSRVTEDLELEIIADNYEGSRLNSPNDLTVHSNGTIYFTDPPFGVDDEDRELDFSGVYRLLPDGELILEFDEYDYPNGIILSHDEERLYVNDSETGNITVFDVDGNGYLSNPQPFASVGPWGDGGAADGMVTDMQGRIYSTGPSGLSVFDADGNHLQDIPFDQPISNVEWSSEDPGLMFITSRDLVYSLQFNVEGYKPR
jgi:gluconolactonase